jgi:hypothetical protein
MGRDQQLARQVRAIPRGRGSTPAAGFPGEVDVRPSGDSVPSCPHLDAVARGTSPASRHRILDGDLEHGRLLRSTT